MNSPVRIRKEKETKKFRKFTWKRGYVFLRSRKVDKRTAWNIFSFLIGEKWHFSKVELLAGYRLCNKTGCFQEEGNTKSFARRAPNTSTTGRCKTFGAKLPGRAHRFLFQRQSLNYLLTKLTGGTCRILSLRDNHRNPNIYTQLAGGAQQNLSSRVSHGSVETVRLQDRDLTMRPDRSLDLRG
ncbi:hypothetical protein TNCV_3749551 [Trichonephila clavipes]|nr:hypothetical protein TNCV_3749551 [Trichonephila clavipes]